MKKGIMEKAGIMLLKRGFTLKAVTRTCFDLVAKKGEQVLLIKLLEDANSVSPDYAGEMNKLSSYLHASPVIIADKAGASLEDNVVYSRFGVYTINLYTFENCLDSKSPFLKSSQAGITVSVNGELLRQAMGEKGCSLALLARKIGVSSRMIQKYEAGLAEVSFNKAASMHKIFGNKVFNRIDIFAETKIPAETKGTIAPTSDIAQKYKELGFEVAETRNVPFNFIARQQEEVILTEVGDKTNPQLSPLTKLLDANSLIIFRNKKPKDMPALKKEEFLELEQAEELINFLREFQ